MVLRQGAYLNAVADIGEFENTLTTDLLNTLVFVQKVFMKEVNEVVQKVYGGEKPVPIWLEGEETSTSAIDRILFSLAIRIKVKKCYEVLVQSQNINTEKYTNNLFLWYFLANSAYSYNSHKLCCAFGDWNG